MVFKVIVDNETIRSDNGVLKLKLSGDADQGLSFDSSGNLIATPGSSSGTGIYNVSGNGIGPTTAAMDEGLQIVGANSTVSRHLKYTGSSSFVINNDGPVMTKLNGNSIATDCIAYAMIPHGGGT
jgi:hypothetical protein